MLFVGVCEGGVGSVGAALPCRHVFSVCVYVRSYVWTYHLHLGLLEVLLEVGVVRQLGEEAIDYLHGSALRACV